MSAFLVEQLEATLRVTAVRRAAGLFVHADGDQNDAGALERVIIAVDNVDLGTERRAIADVGRYRLGGLAVAVDEDDLTRDAADDGGHRAGAADIAGANNSDLHGLLRCRAVDSRAADPLTRSPAASWILWENVQLAVRFSLIRPGSRARRR